VDKPLRHVGMRLGGALPLRLARRRFVAMFESYYLRAQLRRHGWNLERTARHAGISERRLRAMMRRHGIERTGVRSPLGGAAG
jgi:DNA-binding NtrC family response regulator